MDEKRMNEGMETFEKSYGTDDMLHEYLGFSQFMQGCFISEDGWIIDTGNFETANLELMRLIMQKVKKHPMLWKMLFMVA